MGYCTADDIRGLLPEEDLIQLTDDEGLGRVNTARVDEAIARAAAEADSYLGGRYAVPMDPVPEVVRHLAVDIAIHALYARRVREVPQVRGERYRAAVRHLGDIARGVGVIPGAGAADAPAEGAPETNVTGESQVFTRSTMEGY